MVMEIRKVKEAFFSHREEVCKAVRAVCFCGEFLQNQEDWGLRRALCMKRDCTQAYWGQYFKEHYNRGLRREELWKLKTELDGPGSWLGEKVPLKNFLQQGVFLLAEEAGGVLVGPKKWRELMEIQMMTDQYRDYRAFVETVYVTGLWEIMKFQQGTNWHDFEGDFRDGNYLLSVLRSLIPEEGREDYDRYCAGLCKEMEKKRVDAMKNILGERDWRLQRIRKEKEGIPVLNLFEKAMEAMGEDEFKQFITERFDDREWEDEEGLDPKLNLRLRKITRVSQLAELFVYGNARLKERLFQYLSEEEQHIIMERWMADYYPADVEKLAGRLERMLCHGQTEGLWDFDEGWGNFYEKALKDSLEKIMGRKVARKELGLII